MAHKLSNFWRDIRGAALIETAFLVPVLGVMACGVADMSLGFRQKLSAQQGADRAVQFALNAGMTTATPALIQGEAVAATGLPTGNVTVTLWLECNGVVTATYPGTTSAPWPGTCTSGTPARYVSVTVTDTYTPKYASMLAMGAISMGPIALQGFAEGRIQ
jgi:Flp pilus assembly protein TadG